MGFYVKNNSDYYEGDRAVITDSPVPQRPSYLYIWDGSTWVLDAQKVAAKAIVDNDEIDRQDARGEAVIQYLVNHTAAECSAYVAANVTNLATAVSFLQRVAMALSVLAKKDLR